MSNDVLRINEVYAQFIHIIDAKDEGNIRWIDVECCLSRSTTDWERKMNDPFGANASYVETVFQL